MTALSPQGPGQGASTTAPASSGSGGPIEVVVVAASEEWRALLRITLGRAGFVVTGYAAAGAEALPLVAQLDPTVIVIDEPLPDMTPVELAQRILTVRPQQTIVVVSSQVHYEPALRDAARRIGIGWVAKFDYDQLGTVIHAALATGPDQPAA